ncbi:MAG: hypothetical protein GY711_18680 [bacterium]|nr:hypothetical protein [bacterium]
MSLSKISIAALTGALACAVGWFVLRGDPVDPDLGLVDKRAELDRVLAARAGAAGSNVGLDGTFAVEPVDEETARRLFVMNNPNFRYDPDAYYGFVPRVDESFEWPEHPGQSWRRVTNGDGLREDDERGLRDGDPRVLVIGDSHAEGACNNPESFANRLEALLADRHPDKAPNVLNTGVVGFSFYNYLGAIGREIAAEPDVVVVAVYGGNDFVETLASHHYFRGSQLPPRRVDYWDKIDRAIAVSNKALAQGLNQVLYFQEHPDQVDFALEAALATAREVRRITEQHGARLVYVYIPPAFEAGWSELDALRERAMRELDLTPADLEVARRIAQRFFAGLAELEIAYLDMGSRFRAQERPMYWKRDLHINLDAHSRIAAELDGWIAGTIADDRPSGVAPSVRAPGPFREVAEDGVVLSEGAFDGEGRRHGEWTRRYANGELRARGTYEHGRRVGEWHWWYDDRGLKKIGSYVGGYQDSEWLEYHRGGADKSRGTWRFGEPDGPWIELDAVGNRVTEGQYAAGERDGEWRIYYGAEDAGKLDRVATFQGGGLDGPFEKWHANGVQLWDGAHAEGKRDGPWLFRHPNGEKQEEGTFDAGARVGQWSFWDEAGVLDTERSGRYEAGERVGD